MLSYSAAKVFLSAIVRRRIDLGQLMTAVGPEVFLDTQLIQCIHGLAETKYNVNIRLLGVWHFLGQHFYYYDR